MGTLWTACQSLTLARWTQIFVGVGCALLACPEAARAEPASPPKPIIGTEGAPSSVRPINASERWFDGATFGFGASYDELSGRTARRFRSPHLGVVLSYNERIRGPWSGGITLWLDDWSVQTGAKESFRAKGRPSDRWAPLRVMSHVEWAPLRWWYGSGPPRAFVDRAIPHLLLGLGYVTFFENREWPPARAEGAAGEAALRWGAGLRTVVPDAVAFNLTLERWRGVKTFDYSGYALTLTTEFGDVGVR